MEIKYVCSLGNCCHTSQFMKDNKLKKCSYPFDWIFSTYNNIIHCIEDDFKTFLDKKYYVSLEPGKCGNTYYNKYLFNHHDPLNNENHYNYFIRCINRFKQLLQCKENKLFIMMIVNIDNIDENIKIDIINFNNKFSKYTKNYKLLVIFQIKNKQKNYHAFTHNDSIDFLELHTLSKSNGIYFDNYDDNNYFFNVITKTYNFNIDKN